MKRFEKIPESVLARIWEGQHFQPDSLKTTEGLDVQVIRRGQKNSDSGPDFKNAFIRIGERVCEGDVELHLTISDWYAHGHDSDPGYNRTMLHVVLWPQNPGKTPERSHNVCKSNGETVPTLIVLPYLSQPLEQLLDIFQHTDHHKQQKNRRCQYVLKDIPFERRLFCLHQMGIKRLYERAQRFEAWLEQRSFQQILYEALCEGLGYSSNKLPFLELARRLPLDYLLSHLPTSAYTNSEQMYLWIQAMLFGTSGLLPPLEKSQRAQTSVCKDDDPDTDVYLTELHSLWSMLRSCLDVTPMKMENWHFFRLRPPNFPTRRIAALSYLISNYTCQPLFENYLQLFNLFSKHPENASQSSALLERTLEIPVVGYWKGRYLFGKPVSSEHDRLFLGQSRMRDMLISAVFPMVLLYALRTSNPELESTLVSLYCLFPSPAWNQVTKTIFTQLFPHEKNLMKKYCTADVYQGMIHLYRHYCSLPACVHCPFGNEKKIFDET